MCALQAVEVTSAATQSKCVSAAATNKDLDPCHLLMVEGRLLQNDLQRIF